MQRSVFGVGCLASIVALSLMHMACWSEPLCTYKDQRVVSRCEGRSLVDVALRCDPDTGRYDQPTGWSERNDCGEGSACVGDACVKTCHVNGDCDRSLQCARGPDGTKFCQHAAYYRAPCSPTASDTNDEVRCDADHACVAPHAVADASIPDAEAPGAYSCQ